MQYNREQKDAILPSASIAQSRLLAAAFRDVKLTQKQIYQLTEGKKHWSEKKQHLIKLAKNFGITISTDE